MINPGSHVIKAIMFIRYPRILRIEANGVGLLKRVVPDAGAVGVTNPEITNMIAAAISSAVGAITSHRPSFLRLVILAEGVVAGGTG